MPPLVSSAASSSYGAPFDALRAPMRGDSGGSYSNSAAFGPQPRFSNIAPAPDAALSSNVSPTNLVDSIFSQSQVRYAPPTSPLAAGAIAAAPTPMQQSLNTITSALSGGGASPADMLGPLQLLAGGSGGGASPLETISKLARNLLTLPAGNPEVASQNKDERRRHDARDFSASRRPHKSARQQHGARRLKALLRCHNRQGGAVACRRRNAFLERQRRGASKRFASAGSQPSTFGYRRRFQRLPLRPPPNSSAAYPMNNARCLQPQFKTASSTSRR